MKDTLANLLSLQQELREINKLNELAFFIAHQSKVVIDYQRAIVWSSWQNKHTLRDMESGTRSRVDKVGVASFPARDVP